MNDSVVERQLALRLSILNGEDRDWILSRVEADARTRLLELLGELEGLGFRVDESMLEDIAVRTQAMAGQGEADESTLSKAVARISKADVAATRSVLATEPGVLRRCIASTCAWPWLDECADDVGGVEIEPSGFVPTDQVMAVVLNTFADLVEDMGNKAASVVPSEASQPSSRGGWFRWLR